MKYRVNTMIWTTRIDERLAPLFVKIKQWGFDGVEFFLSLEEPANIAAANKMLDAAGLERTTCSVLSRKANLVSSDAQVAPLTVSPRLQPTRRLFGLNAN
jgi:sugar phosphate isomerase/epimerase